jgi:serralysin
MKLTTLFQKILPVLFIVMAFTSHAQQQFTHTATKENISCNNDCTILDVADLNGNPAAVIFVTPVLDKGTIQNPHPICAYYFKSKWYIFNLDRKAIPAGSKFSVEYFTSQDMSHFQYSFTRVDIQADGSALIDHPLLNNNPTAKFNSFHSWNPGSQEAPLANPEEVTVQYNPGAGKWSISNTNKKPFYARVTYNIAVLSGDNVIKNPVKNERDSASYKAVEIRELIIKATVPSTTVTEDPAKSDSIKFIKTTKTIAKPDTMAIINRPVDKKDIVTKKTTAPSYDFSNVHICIEEITNKILPPKTPVAYQPVIPKIKANGEIEPVTTVTQPLSVATDLMWTPGESISVGFLPGETISVINKIKTFAKEWEKYANIKFVFINDVSQAKIKVGFKKDGTSWSWIGRDVLVNLFEGKTMNLGWVNDNLPESEFRRVVLHEFGHTLGFIHEHQSPAAGIPWDTAKVYSYFGGSPNYWNHEKVDQNVLNKYSATRSNSSTYDKFSIMHYSYPAYLTTDSSTFPENTDLSAVDKVFASKVYPYPPGPVTSKGVLLTGDDCDEIEFKVEYNVVNINEVVFILEPGRDRNNNIITWWKKIAIPLKGGVETGMEMQDGYSASLKLPMAGIDETKGIAFGKAKFAGVHTRLGYTWKVWGAIRGGCRISFVWRRDSCN